MPFFNSLGFEKPERKGIADFLQVRWRYAAPFSTGELQFCQVDRDKFQEEPRVYHRVCWHAWRSSIIPPKQNHNQPLRQTKKQWEHLPNTLAYAVWLHIGLSQVRCCGRR